MRDLKREFSGRTVFVTGADGFLGSHLTEKLVEFDADVYALVRATSSGGLNNINHLKDKITLIRGDLSDPHSTKLALSMLKDTSTKPIIFHLAAQAHVGESWERPYETMMVNAIGTLNLLQAVVDLDLDLYKFDTAGTSEEFGNIDEDNRHMHSFDSMGELILHERSPINPKSIYATSKLAADFLTMNYYDAYGLPGVVTRMFNNYGPRQNPRYVTGTIITQALEKDEILLGNLEPKRDFCYVSDGVRGHIYVALWGKAGEVYTYGYGKNISIGDWAELILKIGESGGYWGEKRIRSVKDRYRPGESDVLELRVGYGKLNEETGWEPTVSWEEGIKKTIEWYANNREKWIDKVDW